MEHEKNFISALTELKTLDVHITPLEGKSAVSRGNKEFFEKKFENKWRFVEICQVYSQKPNLKNPATYPLC